MRKVVLLVLAGAVLVSVALSVDGAFYATMFERGKTSFRQGRYPQAIKELRIASFGMLGTVTDYQTALIYLAIAQHRVGDTAGSTASVRKVVDAERVGRTYRTLPLETSIRVAFEGLASTILSQAEFANLVGTGAEQPASVAVTEPPPAPPVVPRTETTITTPPVEVETRQREAERTEAERRETERVEAQRRDAERREAQLQAQRREAERRQEAQRREAERQQPIRRSDTPLAVRSPQLSDSERRQLNEADEALRRRDFDRAHQLYSQLLNSGRLSREAMLEVGRGLYQTGDFAGAVTAFSRAGALQRGEEQYHYYAAVALFETGSFSAAKRQLACALPFIEVTDDVARYQAKIQSAIE